MNQPIRVAVTGAGGQIGYALLFRLASGAAFGPDQPVALQLLEITPALPALDGTLMELEDCAFPLLNSAVATDKPEQAFERADWVILVGGLPRKEGQSRADLIRANSPIFTGQGKAINSAAGAGGSGFDGGQPVQYQLPDRAFALSEGSGRSLVCDDAAGPEPCVGDPGEEGRRAGQCGQPHDDLGQSQRHAVSRLQERQDQRRGRRRRSSRTRAWFEDTFIPTVAKRGSAVIKARGASSAASAANAIVDSLRSITSPTPSGDCFSAAVLSDGSYDIPAGLIYSFPLVSEGACDWSIVPGVAIDAEARKRLDASAAELISERDAIKELLGAAI